MKNPIPLNSHSKYPPHLRFYTSISNVTFFFLKWLNMFSRMYKFTMKTQRALISSINIDFLGLLGNAIFLSNVPKVKDYRQRSNRKPSNILSPGNDYPQLT